MKLVCPYSGETYLTTFFNDDKQADPHPIFRLPTRTLLAKARKWGESKYSETESRLLFLALMNSTSAVTFQTYAYPSAQTVSAHMEGMFKMAAWWDTISGGRDQRGRDQQQIDLMNTTAANLFSPLTSTSKLKLPSYRVSEHNWQLNNISQWLSSLYECRKEWLQPSHRRHLQDILERREANLSKLIHSPHKRTEQYAAKLASWAMDAADVPADKRDRWTQLFKLKGDEVFTVSSSELEQLKDHLETALFSIDAVGSGYGSQYALTALRHIRELYET